VWKWHHLNGQLLLHYERFVFLPPPFNLLHFSLHVLAYIIPTLKKKWITEARWRLVGKWQHDETWKVQQKLELFNERMDWPYGGINMYSTSVWREKVHQDINKTVEEKLTKAHEDVVRNILRMWQKSIKKKEDINLGKNGFKQKTDKFKVTDILHTAWINKSLPNPNKLLKYRLERLEQFFLESRRDRLRQKKDKEAKEWKNRGYILIKSPHNKHNAEFKSQKISRKQLGKILKLEDSSSSASYVENNDQTDYDMVNIFMDEYEDYQELFQTKKDLGELVEYSLDKNYSGVPDFRNKPSADRQSAVSYSDDVQVEMRRTRKSNSSDATTTSLEGSVQG